ncbi:MAG: SDR family oxidoreductase [Myxococcota bacterium]
MATALVTGANRGIGLEICKILKGRGDHVIGACRNASDDLTSLGVQVEANVDVGDLESLRALDDRLGDTAIDTLVLNAGVLRPDNIQALDFDGMRTQFEINSLGPLRTVTALRKRLHKDSKVAIVTSRMGSLADNTSGGMYGYRMSKAAVNAAGVSLAQDLKSDGIPVVLLHPGFVRTGMTGGNGNINPDESAQGLVARIDELTLDTTGSFKHMNGESLPW